MYVNGTFHSQDYMFACVNSIDNTCVAYTGAKETTWCDLTCSLGRSTGCAGSSAFHFGYKSCS